MAELRTIAAERSPGLVLLLLQSFLLCGTFARADLPSIRFDQLLPLGGAAGSSVQLEIKGGDMEGVDRLLFDHPGLTALPVPEKANHFELKIAPDVPTGTYDVYLVGRFGVSNPRLFAVTNGLKDVVDNGQNRSLQTAQSVEMNSAINGVADGNVEDFYRFPLTQGQRVTIDCLAQRLDSSLDAVLSLTTADGRILSSNGDYFGQDPFLDYIAEANGDCIVSVNDLSYRGGQPYRLVVSDRPQVENLFPAAVQVGKKSTLIATGRNLATIGGKPSNRSEGTLPLDELTFEFEPSVEMITQGGYQFRDHPTHHSVAPTAATCTLVGQQVSIPGVDAIGSMPPVLVTSDPVLIDLEPNDTVDMAQPVDLPLVVGGRFDRSQDADWYAFTPKEKGPYTFNVYCERIAGRADPYLVLVDDKGNRLNELDDFGHRTNAFDGHLRDPSQEVNLEQDRQYKVLVQDRYGSGGARSHYVLEVRKAEPDFFAAMIHRSNQNPAGTTLFKGTATYLDIIIHHRGNSRSDITITGENLPPGLHIAPTTITNDTRGSVVLWADADAPDFTGPIQLVASSQTDGKLLRRAVRPYSRVWNNSGTSLVHRSQMVAIREPGPFDLRIEPQELEVRAGQTAELTLSLSRLWPDLKGQVSIQPLAFSGNFELGNFEISADATSAPLKIKLQENTRPGRYTLSVLGRPKSRSTKTLPRPTNRRHWCRPPVAR